MAGASVPNGQQRSTDISGEKDTQGEEDTEEEELEEDIEDEESSVKERNVRKPAKEQKPSSSSDVQRLEESMADPTRKYLTDSQREIVERLVESNMSIFETITSSVEQREKKMSLWRTIAREVNCEPSRREITPEELRTLWSKHLFLKHVNSRKSKTNEADSRGSVGATQVFKSLIAKRGVPQDKKSQSPCVQNSTEDPVSKSCDLSEEEERVYDEQIAKFRKVFTACDQRRVMKLKEVWSEITRKVNEVNKGRGRTVSELQRRLTMSLIKQKKSQSVGQQVLVGNNSRETSKTADTSEPPDVPIKIEIDNAESEESEIIHVVRNRASETETEPTVPAPQGRLPDHCSGVQGTNSDSSGEGPVTVKEEPLDGANSQPFTSHLCSDNKGSLGLEMTVRERAYIEEQVKTHKALFLDSSKEATVGHAGVLKAMTSTLNRKHNTSYTCEHVTTVAMDFINKLSHVNKRIHSADVEGSTKRTRVEESMDVSKLMKTSSVLPPVIVPK